RRHRVRLETGRSQGAAPIARARIEGEGEHRFALTAEQRVWARSDPRLVTTPPARTADGWAVCSARTRSSAGSTRNPVRSLTSPRNIEGHEAHEEDWVYQATSNLYTNDVCGCRTTKQERAMNH